MTIKEAFQQLANATKKGMKNPFFIMRSLNKNFSEIADKIEGGGGGGSTVVVNPILTEGTKIATITVDGEANDLYAPAGGGGGGSWTKLGKYMGGTEINLPLGWSELLVTVAFSRGSSGTAHGTTNITHDFITNYFDLDTWIDFTCSTYEKGLGRFEVNKNGLKASLSYVQDPAGTQITSTSYAVVYYK